MNAFHCAQMSAVKSTTSTIKMPPMPGTPFLVKTWLSIVPASCALSRYSWPNLSPLSHAMTNGPSHRLKIKAEMAAPAVRTVM